MIALGIDPSTKATGWCVMNEDEDILAEGVIKGLADDPSSFHMLYEELSRIIDTHKPEHVRCETQFIGPGKQTSIKLIRPTGVILAVTGRFNVPFDFKAPAAWRKVVHGGGTSWKKRDTYDYVEDVYGNVIELKSYNKDNDRTDAIGVALSVVREKNSES